jgi:ATP synthase protein I
MPFNRPIPNSKRQSKMQSGVEALVQAEKLLQIALMLPCAVAIGWLLGAWADSRLHQSWMTVTGVILGAVSGLSFVIRMAISAEKASPADTGPEEEEGPTDLEK